MVDFLTAASAGTSILSGVKGLFGGGSSPTKQMKTQLSYDRQKYLAMSEGARNAGFNPLTVLQAGGANTGFTASAGGAPPLASAEILSDGLRDLNDELSGENERRRIANQLEQDLAKVKLDTMRAALAGPSAADAVGLGPSTFGRRAATVVQSNVRTTGAENATDPRLSHSVVLPDGKSGGVGLPDSRLDRGTGSFVEGSYFQSRPGWSPASVIEEEYGDVGSALYGFGKLGADIYHNVFVRPNPDEEKHPKRPSVEPYGPPEERNPWKRMWWGLAPRRPADNAFTRRNQKSKNQQSK